MRLRDPKNLNLKGGIRMDDLNLLVNIDFMEILLISTISFIGAFGHEFMLFLNQNKRITMSVWGEIFITMVTVTIISLSINPFVSTVHPRLILLPPLLLSLLGEELLNKLIHIDKSSKLFITILKFLHVKLPENVDLPEAEVSAAKNPDRHVELLKQIIDLKVNIEDNILQYNDSHNAANILSSYKQINTDVSLIKLKLREDPDVEDIVITEYKEMVDSFNTLTSIRAVIITNKKANIQSNEVVIIDKNSVKDKPNAITEINVRLPSSED